MKLQLKSFSVILLPVLLAGAASAQVVRGLPGGYNPHIGAPVTLPGPVVSPSIGMKIELPAPRLNPGLSVSLAPAPAVAVMTVIPVLPMPRIPSRPIVPIIHPTASHENVAHPLAPILPGLRVQLDEAKAKKDWRKDLGDEVFDGRLIPNRRNVVVVPTAPSPVRPSRRVTLPEWDLESEIGIR